MSLRQLVGVVAIAAAGYALWRRSGGATLPQITLSPPTARIPAVSTPSNPQWTAAQLEAFLKSRGLTANQARGVAAGAYAESRLNPAAVNPKSGAFGIGQWLGSRKAELFRRYGARPSLAQQMEFLVWELAGGDHGGAAVLAQNTPHGVLDAYIRRFMRPAAGAETAGDLARGARYISAAG